MSRLSRVAANRQATFLAALETRRRILKKLQARMEQENFFSS